MNKKSKDNENIVAPNRATKKKKNTYVVKISAVMANLSAFELCDSTPMAVVTINGKPVQNASGAWMHCTPFPNPAASNMAKAFSKLEPLMGEKMASTIIEYLDKDTNDPVALLFPTNEIMCRNDLVDFMKRLNHASRHDLNRQMQIRERMMHQALTKQK